MLHDAGSWDFEFNTLVAAIRQRLLRLAGVRHDDGWETVFVNYLRVSRLNERDMIFILSVGGGDLEKNISPNLVRALQYAKEVGATVCGIVGRAAGAADIRGASCARGT